MRVLPSNSRRQQGVALISVLLVFAIVSVIAAEMINLHFLDIRKTSNVINSKQAYFHALAGEEFVRQVLYRDYQEKLRNQSDSYLDNWQLLDGSFEIEEGEIIIQVEDLQGLFNVNNLLVEGRIQHQEAELFKQLLTELGISLDIASQLQDWLDIDDGTLPSGAESADYLAQTAPYLAANRPLADRSELRLLKNMDEESYLLLLPLVTALPEKTRFNLNTLNKTVLAALIPHLSETQLKEFGKKQQSGGYTTVSEWLSQPVGQHLNTLRSQLTVQSSYFQSQITVNYAGRISQLQTVYYRNPDDGEINILSRQNRIE